MTQVQSYNPSEGLSEDQIKTLSMAGVIPSDTPKAVVDVFAVACSQHALSPFRKEIYLVKYKTKRGPQYHTIVGIDGARVKAARTGSHAGIDDPKFDISSDGSYMTAAQMKQKGKLPTSCTVTVYRMVEGQRCPFSKTVLFAEYYPAVDSGQSDFSKATTMPFNMIAKCAEFGALKMAFSDELSGLNIEEEKAAFEDTTIQVAESNPSVAVDRDDLEKELQEIWDTEELLDKYQKNPGYKNHADLFTDRKNEIAQLKSNGQIEA